MANKELVFLERTTVKEDPRIPLGPYLVRDSMYETMIHRCDEIKNVGFDWRPNLMKKSLSSYLLTNKEVSSTVQEYNGLMAYIVERIQDIRKFVNYTVPKNYKYSS